MSERLFLAEGPQAVREALASDVPDGREPCVVEVFATYDADDRHQTLREAAAGAGARWHLVDSPAVAGLTGTVTPQGIVAVCRFVDVTIERALAGEPRLVAVCANVRDPGNAGSVIRCADAAGADAVIVAGESVDPYNGKAVRASAGSLFHLPVVLAPDVAGTVRALHAADLTVVAADAEATLSLDEALAGEQLRTPTAWLFGNEAWGLRPADTALVDQTLRVPIYGRAESLNLATAAAICLYASAWAQRSPERR